MTYAPPIAKRRYLKTIKNAAGKIISTECARCRKMKDIKGGVWFEHSVQHDAWYWICKGCLK